MERLTDKIGNTNCVKGCGSNCKYGFQYCRKEDWENCETIADVIDKLADYEDLEEQGRLIKLPCKVGDWIFIVKRYWVEEANITGISEADDISCFCFKVYIDPDCEEIVALEDFNETWFLTKSEAEAKLKELRGGENESSN